jgi:thymidylate synthase
MAEIIKSPSVARSYEILIEKILNEGDEVFAETGDRTKELRNIIIEITNPKLKRISEKYPLGKNSVELYIQHLLYGSENEFSYDYHSRLFEWECNTMVGAVNQIDYIVDKLKNEKNSRRALAITWIPYFDDNVNDSRASVPCLQYIQFLIRNKKMEMTVLFRSNDALLAYHANALGLISLGELIADRIGVKLSKYTHHSVSMHIYVDRDENSIKKYFR